MTIASARREGRRVARSLADRDSDYRARVLAVIPAAVREAAVAHLAVLDHAAQRDTAAGAR